MRLALASLVVVLSGCSAIVSLSDDDIRCAVSGGVDPCPSGRMCREGFCVPEMGIDAGPPDAIDCIPNETPELCNGIDDDCDMEIDEGHDQDMDDFTWCGGGDPTLVDCDDNDPNSHPGRTGVVEPAAEVCDGTDNDCDSMIDEDDGSGVLCPAGLSCIERICADPNDCSLSSVTCPAGESCDFDENPPRCVPGGCTDASCTPPEICNTESGECVQPGDIGDPCDTDVDCAGATICVSNEAIGLAGGRFCTTPCCDDGECADGNICRVAGTGVKLCTPPGLVGTSRGSGLAGDPCTTHGECASGVCIDSMRCLGNCGTDADCDGGLACTATVTDDLLQFACDVSAGTVDQGDVDFFGEGCRSKLFSGYACGGFGCGEICVGSCRTSTDCPDMIADTDYFCGFGSVAMYDSTFAVCTEARHDGEAVTGGMCSDNRGCRDLTCIMGTCADTCCTNADCPAPTSCRPIQIRGHWETHCI